MNQKDLIASLRYVEVFDDSKEIIQMLHDTAQACPQARYICNEAAVHIAGLWDVANRLKKHCEETL